MLQNLMRVDKMMLSLVLYSLISIVNAKLSDEIMNDWAQIVAPYAEECVEESGANPIIATNMYKNSRFADEEHMRCFIKCINSKYGIISPDGVFKVDVWISTVKHLTPEVGKMCYKKYGDEEDLCKKSYQLAVCVAQENYETE